LCAALLVACTSVGQAEPDREPESFTDEESTVPSQSDRARSARPKPSPAVGGTVTGMLGFDDIEGGCAFVEAQDGTRYEVIYPDGWTLDRASGELRSDDGAVAMPGDAVTVRGAVATDRSSICQIGPIFVATDVEVAAP
jgi:hypothetical protein